MASVLGGAVYEILSKCIVLWMKENIALMQKPQSGKQRIQTRKMVSIGPTILRVGIHGLQLRTEPEAGQKEKYSSWALFILIMLLIVALFASYMLQHKKIQVVHETVLSIFAGGHIQLGNLALGMCIDQWQVWLLALSSG